MTTNTQYLLLVQQEGYYIPIGRGTKGSVIDYLSEYTIDILTRVLSSGAIRYEDIWNYYDEHFNLGAIRNIAYPLLGTSHSFSYMIFPIDSIPIL